MKNFLFFILGFVLVFAVGIAFAAGPGSTPLTNIILLNSPTANTTLDSILAQQGSTPILDNMVNQANGTYVRTLPATQTTAQTIQTLSPNSSWSVAGGILTTLGMASARWNPMIGGMISGVGQASIALGYLANYEFDLKKAYDHSWLQGDSALKHIIDNTFPANLLPQAGDIFTNGSQNYQLGTLYNFNGTYSTGIIDQMSLVFGTDTAGTYSGQIRTLNGHGFVIKGFAFNWNGSSYYYYDEYLLNVTAAPATYPTTGAPSTLSNSDIAKLGQAFADAALNDPLVKKALENVVNSHPETINAPYPISKQDINNYKNNNVSAALNQAATTITNISNANPADTAAATASATATANATVNDNKETFDRVPANAFATPYAKDPVSFTDRLNTFFTNVKSSPLFSFSQGFFNSIPGGGSPIFHVPAGIYGDHYYDMSQTMTGGLAVMKAALLCVFGFLSIRAVIMKR